MKQYFAFCFFAIIGMNFSLSGLNVELNSSYDYFRGLPDGSWNGNSGALISTNINEGLYDCVSFQLGGSFGVYNWDGRDNLVFQNTRASESITFLTGGFSATVCPFNFGLVYDHMFTNNFGIYATNPNMNQVRFKVGYPFRCEEFGLWGSAHLKTANETALGVPLTFRAINQLNAFWTHNFNDYAQSTVWVGAPYTNSLKFPHKKAGTLIAGFALQAPLSQCLSVDGRGSYMAPRNVSGDRQSNNYVANICVGITYTFTNGCSNTCDSYLPLASHSNFFVDTNLNQ